MQNYKIDGVGRMGGGVYGHVQIDGAGSCSGSLQAESVEIDGSFRCDGGMQVAGRLACDGAGKCAGDVQAEELQVDGAFTCQQHIAVSGKAECDGALKCAGISAKAVQVDGALKVQGGGAVEAELLECDGCAEVEGQVNADRVEVDGIIKAKEIVGEHICIDSSGVFGNGRNLLGLFSFGMRGSAPSSAELIEATRIELSGVKAKNVNGQDIWIGRGCEIEAIDCSGSLKIDADAHVGTVTGNYTRVE